MNLIRPSIRLPRLINAVDLLVLFALGGIVYLLMNVGREWTGAFLPSVEIDLHTSALPRYAMFSLFRNFAAYLASLAFALVFGRLAALNRRTEMVLLPILDILQSVPVMGFLPGLVLAFVALFPNSNTGLELACILMMFTSQAWNMTFSFYQSVKSLPPDLLEAARMNRLTWWQRFLQVELPCGASGLVWNSMMSMAGGWFFLMVCEAFTLGHRDFRLPGLGSYMSVAIEHGDVPAMIAGLVAMTVVIVLLDQLMWRPLVAWAEKFRLGDEPPQTTSALLGLLQRSRVMAWVDRKVWWPLVRWGEPKITAARREARHPATAKADIAMHVFGWGSLLALVVLLGWGGSKLIGMLAALGSGDWRNVGWWTVLTFVRVNVAVLLGALWAVPVGVMIGMNPRLSKIFQPVIQVLASFPAPMIFPLLLAALLMVGVPLGWGSIVLTMSGTQWYILFNVISGAAGIPQDLREAAQMNRLRGVERWRQLILPSIYSPLIVGLATAAGGGWNASIVTEYVRLHEQVTTAQGLGSAISIATDKGNFPLLAASVLAMCVVVVGVNRWVWQPLYRLGEKKYSMGAR